MHQPRIMQWQQLLPDWQQLLASLAACHAAALGRGTAAVQGHTMQQAARHLGSSALCRQSKPLHQLQSAAAAAGDTLVTGWRFRAAATAAPLHAISSSIQGPAAGVGFDKPHSWQWDCPQTPIKVCTAGLQAWTHHHGLPAVAASQHRLLPQAVAGCSKPYSTNQRYQQQQHRQQRQQQQGGAQQPLDAHQHRRQPAPAAPSPLQVPPLHTPWKTISNKKVAKLLESALTPQQAPEQRTALLHAALESMLQQRLLQHTPPKEVSALLYCFELGRAAVLWPAMQQLLQHLSSSAQLCDVKDVLRVLRSASFSKLAANSKVRPTDSSSSNKTVLLLPSVQALLQQAWLQTAGGSAALRPALVPQLLRCASILLDQQQPLPQDLLEIFINHWASSSSSSRSTADINDSDSDSPQQQQLAQQAAVIIKAVGCMGKKVNAAELQLLIQPVQAMVDTALQHLDRSSSSSSSSSSSRAGAEQGGPSAAAAAADLARWLPPLLMATHRLDAQGVLQEQQRAQALSVTSSALQALAAATQAQAAHAGLSSSSSSRSSRSSTSSGGNNSSLQAGTASSTTAPLVDSILEIIKTLAVVQRASPINKVPGLVDDLTHALLAADVPFGVLATLLSSLAGLNLSPSLECMTAATAAACAQLQQLQKQLQQQQQQQQQMASINSHNISQFLWACASMGYSLGTDELQLMLQQQLHVLRPPSPLQVTQTLWAIANMGVPLGEEDVLLLGALPAQEEVAARARLPAEVASLACALLSRVLDEQHKASAGHPSAPAVAGGSDGADGSFGGGSGDSSSSSSSSTADEGGNAWVHINTFCGAQKHSAWQLSLAAWAAAMCDLESCKDTVLQLCSILARPQMWDVLRHSELVQLAAVHLWLCGDYQWSDTAGLAAVLTSQQLQHMRMAKVLQTQRTCGVGTSPQAGVSTQQHQHHQQQAGELAMLALQPRDLKELQNMDRQCLPELPVSKRKAAAAANAAAKAAASRHAPAATASQISMCKALKSLRGIQSAQLETATPDLLFHFDVLAETTSGQQLAVEFDGPHHYTVMVPSCSRAGPQQQQQLSQFAHKHPPGVSAAVHAAVAAPSSLRVKQQQQQQQQPPRLVPVRRMMFRNKALAARGYAVICVPFSEWAKRPGRPEQLHYLRLLVKQAMLNSPVGQHPRL